MKRNIALFMTLFCMVLCLTLTACGGGSNRTVVIYTSAEDYRNDAMQADLNARFPNYTIKIEYYSTGNLFTKLLAEGTDTECDIIGEMEYANLDRIVELLADLSSFNTGIYTSDMVPETAKYLPWYRNGGCIAVNRIVLSERNLPVPESYIDLLNPVYRGLISMPNPLSSGTGYMFLKSLVNAWGEQEAFNYFDALSHNILGFTSSGSGPVNLLREREAAIGFAMTAQTVSAINDGFPLRIHFFQEGSPFSLYGIAMIRGKETRREVSEVFAYIVNVWTEKDKLLFCPERIFNDREFTLPNYPINIRYADMSDNTSAEKERLLERWTHR